VRLIFIASQLTPVLGMERSALSLIRLLGNKYSSRVYTLSSLAGDVPIDDVVELPGARGLVGRLDSIRRLRRLSRLIDETDVVILIGVWVAIPWLIIVPRRLKRNIVWEHTLLSEKNKYSFKSRVLFALARCTYWRANEVVAVSQPVADDLGAFSVGRVTVIPNLAEPDDLQTNVAKSDNRSGTGKRLLAVGSLSAIKAQNRIISALVYLPEDYTLSIIGAGPLEISLKKQVRDLGLAGRVEFTGHLDAQEVRSRMKAADVLVHSAVAETFGLVFAEAADCELPVVAVSTRAAQWLIPTYVPGALSSSAPEQLAIVINGVEQPSRKEWDEAQERRQREFGAEVVEASWETVISRHNRPWP
jgi:glycosyltransferase involved in cell wall biosynthesis